MRPARGRRGRGVGDQPVDAEVEQHPRLAARSPIGPGVLPRRRCWGRNAFSARSVHGRRRGPHGGPVDEVGDAGDALAPSVTAAVPAGADALGVGRHLPQPGGGDDGVAGRPCRRPAGPSAGRRRRARLRSVAQTPGGRRTGDDGAVGGVRAEPAQLVADQLGHRQRRWPPTTGLLELGEHPDGARAGGVPAGDVHDLGEGEDAPAAVVGGVQRPQLGQPLHGAQRAQLGEGEVLGEPAGTGPSSTSLVVRRAAELGRAAMSVDQESSLSCRTIRAPSRLMTRSGSISSAPRSIASSKLAAVCSGR